MNQRAQTNTPTPPPALTEAEKALCAKAADLEPLLSTGWVGFYNTEERRTEIFVEGDTGPMARPLALLTEETGHADRELLVRGAQMVRALVASIRRLGWRVEEQKAEIRRLKGEPDPNRRKLSEDCDFWCRNQKFQTWLRDHHGADISDLERIRARVRTMLQVKSRSELDENSQAAAKWHQLLSDFKGRER